MPPGSDAQSPERGRNTALLPLPLTSFIGRERATEQVLAFLHDPIIRLVTLTGPGGVGKTRLAIRVAAEAEGAFDGVAFVPLASISSRELVLPAVAQAVGVREAEDESLDQRLVAWLRDKRLLLVLDNLEQVIAAAPEVAGLLTAAPGIKVLATSRIPLHVSGEHEYPVPPLTLPAPGGASNLDDVMDESEAVRLFVERVRSSRPRFALTPQVMADVADLCRRLDGLPLAIELAASRARMLSPSEIIARLERPLPLLTGGPRDAPARHQTLRNTVAWSYDLLAPGEQALYRRLAVFDGGFSLEAAEAVSRGVEESSCRADVDSLFGSSTSRLLDSVATLVDHSLVRYEPGPEGEERFGLLETIREFGLECLAAAGEQEQARAAHAAYFLRLAERAEPVLVGSGHRGWLRRLEAEHANLRAAFGWAADREDTELALRLGGALWLFWATRGYMSEGANWLEQALSWKHEVPADVRGRGVFALGMLAWSRGDNRTAEALAEQSLAMAESWGDALGAARAVFLVGRAAAADREIARAQEAFRLAHDRYEALGDAAGVAATCRERGRLAHAQGDLARAEEFAERTLELNRADNFPWGTANALHDLGRIAADRGDAARAARLFGESLDLLRSLDDHWYIALPLAGLARVAADTGDHVRAAHLAGFLDAQREELGSAIWRYAQPNAEAATAMARASLGDAVFGAAWEEGRTLSFPAATAMAAEVAASAPRIVPRPTQASPDLSRRELEVLQLLAAGRSDREIGEELFISPRTASKHVANILAKLGVPTRAAAVALAYEGGLA